MTVPDQWSWLPPIKAPRSGRRCVATGAARANRHPPTAELARACFPSGWTPHAYDIAKAMLTASTATYRLFRTESARAKHRSRPADWHGQQRAQRERIEFYDLREGMPAPAGQEFKAGASPMDVWHQVKLHYIGLLVAHQPRAGRDLLQLGHHQDPAPHAFPQRLHLRAPRPSHRVHRRTKTRRARTYRAYYPAAATCVGGGRIIEELCAAPV